MTVAVIVLAVVAAVLAGVVIALAARARRLNRDLIDARESLQSERDAVAERDAALATSEERAVVAERHADAADATVVAMEAERRELDDRATEVVAERDRLSAEVERLTADNEDAAAEVVALGEKVADLEERAERFRDEHRPGLDATALWHLELARAERTWRHSVAVSLDQSSPFADTDDPLRSAVEIEVAALREEVGVSMELEWTAVVDDLARRLIVLRVVQELLAAASRSEQAVVLTGTSHDDSGSVELHMRVPEDHDPMEVVHLDGVEHLISIDTTDGVRVTVH